MGGVREAKIDAGIDNVFRAMISTKGPLTVAITISVPPPAYGTEARTVVFSMSNAGLREAAAEIQRKCSFGK